MRMSMEKMAWNTVLALAICGFMICEIKFSCATILIICGWLEMFFSPINTQFQNYLDAHSVTVH